MLLLGCGAGGGGGIAATPAVDLEGLLPSAAVLDDGWRVVDGPTSHGPDTLYEYLDGGAERYVDHGFRRLVHARYQRGDDPLACVTVDVFDMGDALGAFGIFSAGRWNYADGISIVFGVLVAAGYASIPLWICFGRAAA